MKKIKIIISLLFCLIFSFSSSVNAYAATTMEDVIKFYDHSDYSVPKFGGAITIGSYTFNSGWYILLHSEAENTFYLIASTSRPGNDITISYTGSNIIFTLSDATAAYAYLASCSPGDNSWTYIYRNRAFSSRTLFPASASSKFSIVSTSFSCKTVAGRFAVNNQTDYEHYFNDKDNIYYTGYIDPTTGVYAGGPDLSSIPSSGESGSSTGNTIVDIDLSPVVSALYVIENKVEAINTSLSAIKTDISTIKSDISNIKGNISTMVSDLSTVKTTLSSLKTAVDNIKTKVDTINTNLVSFKALFDAGGGFRIYLDEKFEMLYNAIMYGTTSPEQAEQTQTELDEFSSNANGLIDNLEGTTSYINSAGIRAADAIQVFSSMFEASLAIQGIAGIMEVAFVLIFVKKLIGR